MPYASGIHFAFVCLLHSSSGPQALSQALRLYLRSGGYNLLVSLRAGLASRQLYISCDLYSVSDMIPRERRSLQPRSSATRSCGVRNGLGLHIRRRRTGRETLGAGVRGGSREQAWQDLVSGPLEGIQTKGGLVEEICRAQVRQAACGGVSRAFATKGGGHRKGGP